MVKLILVDKRRREKPQLMTNKIKSLVCNLVENLFKQLKWKEPDS